MANNLFNTIRKTKAADERSKSQYLVILAFLGSLISMYLVYDHYRVEESALCDINETVSCSAVNQSAYSELLGVPLAVFGVLWFLFEVAFALKIYLNDPRDVHVFAAVHLLWTGFGVLFVFYLIWAEYMIGAICPFCTLVHIIIAVMAYYSWSVFQIVNKQPSVPQIMDSTKLWIIAIVFVFLIPLLLFNSGSMGEAPTANKDLLTSNPPSVVEGNTQEDYDNRKFTPDELLAKCITKNNVRMFGSRHCGACQSQKARFGEAFPYIIFRDCADDMTPCKEHNIEGYPTWVQFEGESDDSKEVKRVRGVQSLSSLATFSECPYESS